MMQVIKTCAALTAMALLSGCSPEAASRLNLRPEPKLQAAPDGYVRLLSPASHNFQTGRASAGDPVRAGKTSERFELREGDCGGNDCLEPRSRAEIRVTDDATADRIGQDTWYGYSFYNATVPSFRKDNSLRLVFGQWTLGGKHRPIFRFIQLGEDEGNFAACDPSVCVGPNTTHGDVVVQLADIANANGWGKAQNDGYVCRLFDMVEQRGSWVDITLNTNFSAGNDGYLKIWVNGQQVCDYAGPLSSQTSLQAATNPHHRRGIFSSFNKRWRASTQDAAKPHLIVYYDEFRRGTSFAEVDVRHRLVFGQ
ncbi:MAG: heparin lyase I family protein [Tateyamaria sp.]|uniref:heparin lyase I family protein n=2 Tax=Tateyamaria sp. TaxID=1929288 RepID=UPI00329D976C